MKKATKAKAKRTDSSQAVVLHPGQARLMRRDGWTNILTGKGIAGKDARMHSAFTLAKPLDNATLDDMYRANGLCRRIVDALPALVTRSPWEVGGDPDQAIWAYLEALEGNVKLRRALRWARLYGGAVMVLGVDDGREFEAPLNQKAIKSLDFIRVYDRYQINGGADDWQDDPTDKMFGEREFFTITPRSHTGSSKTQESEYRVHHSRVIKFDGMDVPDRGRNQQQGWGDSILQVVYEEVERFSDGLDDAGLLLRDFVQGVLKVKGLTSILASANGDDLIRARLEILDLSRHMLNTMLLDDGEDYTKQSSSTAGIAEILDRLGSSVSTAVDIPQTVLFGRGPSGLNASGADEIRAWYDSGASFQREQVLPAVRRMAELACLAKDFKAKPSGVKPEAIQITFAPLWQATEKEKADTAKVRADTDNIYLAAGVLDADEVRDSRFGGEDSEITLKLAAAPGVPEPEPKSGEEEEEEEEEAKGEGGPAA